MHTCIHAYMHTYIHTYRYEEDDADETKREFHLVPWDMDNTFPFEIPPAQPVGARPDYDAPVCGPSDQQAGSANGNGGIICRPYTSTYLLTCLLAYLLYIHTYIQVASSAGRIHRPAVCRSHARPHASSSIASSLGAACADTTSRRRRTRSAGRCACATSRPSSTVGRHPSHPQWRRTRGPACGPAPRTRTAAMGTRSISTTSGTR